MIKKTSIYLWEESIVKEFEHQLRYYIHSWTNTHGQEMDSFMCPPVDQIPLLFFNRFGFGIK